MVSITYITVTGSSSICFLTDNVYGVYIEIRNTVEQQHSGLATEFLSEVGCGTVLCPTVLYCNGVM